MKPSDATRRSGYVLSDIHRRLLASRRSFRGFAQTLIYPCKIRLRRFEPRCRRSNCFAKILLSVLIFFDAHERDSNFVESLRGVHHIEQAFERLAGVTPQNFYITEVPPRVFAWRNRQRRA